jgi:hypothetical protein
MTLRPHIVCMMLIGMTAAAMPAHGEQPRVFFTTVERQHITQQRRTRDTGGTTSVAAATQTTVETGSSAAPTPRELIRLDGVSVPVHGRPAAWIDGKRFEDGAVLNGHRLQVTHAGIRLLGSGNERLVRVGQTLYGEHATVERSR